MLRECQTEAIKILHKTSLPVAVHQAIDGIARISLHTPTVCLGIAAGSGRNTPGSAAATDCRARATVRGRLGGLRGGGHADMRAIRAVEPGISTTVKDRSGTK